MTRFVTRHALLWIVSVALLAGGSWAWGQQARPAGKVAPNVRPKTAVTTCTTDGCHTKERTFPYVHGPVAVGACSMCHKYADASKHTFTLKHEKRRLCDFCHIGRAVGLVVHKPVQQGECLGCHHPHGSANRELLRKEDTSSLCDSCHDSVTRSRKSAHGPVRTGSCGACHKSHTSSYPKLLIAGKRKLCLDCHKQMDLELAQVRYLHKPVEDECLACHEAHASNHTRHLKLAPAKTCFSCHDHRKIEKLILDASRKHTPVTEDLACINCHTAHGSDWANLMKGPASVTCLECHDKPIKAIGNSPAVASVAELAEPGANKHGPIRYDNCGGCHEVHGGSAANLLTAPHPEDFYEPFEVSKYGLCFSCHTPKLATLKETVAVTDFRNGPKNLHYVHVSDPKRGRNCRACHSTHASKNPMHVATSVPFGSWQLPINFAATKTGGACASGCHRKLAYDRVKPVKLVGLVNPTTMPAGPDARWPTSQPAGRRSGPALLPWPPADDIPTATQPADK